MRTNRIKELALIIPINKLNQETFITQKPNKTFLRNYISYYYFHEASKEASCKHMAFYPNTKNALTIYKNSKTVFTPFHAETVPDNDSAFSFIYSGVQKRVRTATIYPPFNKIGIVFQELGINHFIEDTLCNITQDTVDKSFNYYGNEFTAICELVYAATTITEKVTILDDFFESKYNAFQEEALIRCIALILDSKKITVQELAETTQLHRKTILRLFKKHLCCSTKEFIDIVQFRKALNDYLLSNKDASFTTVALDNEYYDQAQFIQHFKKLTGINPKAFFKDVVHLGSEDTFWTFK